MEVLELCKEGIINWRKSFNAKDAHGCAEQYTEDCIMLAKPFGKFTGRDNIKKFWQGIIDQGFSDVNYTDVQWIKEGEDGFLLKSKWTMNKAYGLVHKEHWKIDSDGKARLVYDEFEILGER